MTAAPPPSANPEDILFFIHIPKTAGTTFRDILSRQFGQAHIKDFSMLFTGVCPSVGQIAYVLEQYANVRAISSHHLSARLPYDMPGRSVRAVTFIREPVALLASLYRYMKKEGRFTQTDHFATPKAWADYLTQGSPSLLGIDYGPDGPNRLPSQCGHLVGPDTPEPLTEITRLVAEQPLSLLPVDRFDEACVCLERLDPKRFPDCSYAGALNVTQTRAAPDPELQAQFQQLPWFADDQALFQMAHDYLDRQNAELFPEPGSHERALADFHQRCAARAKAAAAYNRPFARFCRRLGNRLSR